MCFHRTEEHYSLDESNFEEVFVGRQKTMIPHFLLVENRQ